MEVVLEFLGAWYNGFFVLPLMVCGLFISVQLAFGLFDHGSDSDAGHDLEAGAGHDVHAGHSHELEVAHDHDVDVDHDVDIGSGGLHPVGLHHEGHGAEGLLAKWHLTESIAGLLGVGKVPITVLLETFGIAWGLIGITLNWTAFKLLGGFSPLALVAIVPAAFIGAAVSTRLIASGLHRLIPSVSSASVRSHTFVGQTGVVVSARVTRTLGEVRISGVGSTPTWIAVRIAPECPVDEVPSGKEVLVTHYDTAANLFHVVPAPIREG